jgi:hypothetical protein
VICVSVAEQSERAVTPPDGTSSAGSAGGLDLSWFHSCV